MKTTLADRVRLVTQGMSETDLVKTLDLTPGAVSQLRNGKILSMKVKPALRLARRANVSPYWLAGESEPVPEIEVSSNGLRFGIGLTQLNQIDEGGPSVAERVRHRSAIAEALRNAGFSVKVNERAFRSEDADPIAAPRQSIEEQFESLRDQLADSVSLLIDEKLAARLEEMAATFDRSAETKTQEAEATAERERPRDPLPRKRATR